MIENLRLAKRLTTLPVITTNQALLTDAWTADVKALQAALGRITADARVSCDCRVTFFEVAGDGHLHVNVAHRAPTGEVQGWAGPGITPDGVVHNRTFVRGPRYQVLRQIRDMIFAARSEVRSVGGALAR